MAANPPVGRSICERVGDPTWPCRGLCARTGGGFGEGFGVVEMALIQGRRWRRAHLRLALGFEDDGVGVGERQHVERV